MDKWIEQLIPLEEDIRYQEPAAEGEPEFRYIQGSIPVLISAPHGAAHERNGGTKQEDEFTAGLAQLIGQATGAHVLYATRKSNTDPNVDPLAPFKQKLSEIVLAESVNENPIGFVLDIHGADAKREYGIELGTANGQSCSENENILVLQTFEEYGFVQGSSEPLTNLWLDVRFTGEGGESTETVTRFVWKKLQIPVAQFEINAHLRIPQRRADASAEDKTFKGDSEMIIRTILAFTALVNNLAEYVSQ